MLTNEIRDRLQRHGQERVLRFWDRLDDEACGTLGAQLATIDFELMDRLIEKWIRNTPSAERFNAIDPVPLIPEADLSRPDAREACAAGEDALRQGRVGLILVAGGQGTRLGFSGPKGSYPIGPISGRSLFAYHAEKIRNLQRRYACTLPWYIMVSAANRAATEAFFREHDYFGLRVQDIRFFQQRMIPCVDDNGAFMLDAPGRLAMNPNGHGGCIPAMVESGITKDARERGVDTLSYFQVDNWAAKVADPFFIGYHVLRGGEMSSKINRRNGPREAVGVHCLCDGEYRVIEYSELDIYPQLLELDAHGKPVYLAGNPAIHILSVPFIERVSHNFREFPWHLAHKKIACIDDAGVRIVPDKPNGYKFETFVFDALRYIPHDPIALEIRRDGEYTPTKQFEGDNSVTAARASMARFWGEWLDEAGVATPRDGQGNVAVDIEISPDFAYSKEEFMDRMKGCTLDINGGISISADGSIEYADNRRA